MKIAIILIHFLYWVSEGLSALELSDAEIGRPASEFIQLCTSIEVDRLDYCEGYIDAALNFWKYGNDQKSTGKIDQSLDGPRILGMEDSMRDMFLHLYASTEFYIYRPCVGLEVTPQQARHILMEFIRENPEQQHNSTAMMILVKALHFNLCPGNESGMKPHMENCTTWTDMDGRLGTKNICSETVTIHFMGEGEIVRKRNLEPDEAFRTELSRLQTGFWMFTTCLAGYQSSVPFVRENDSIIRSSRYKCVRK